MRRKTIRISHLDSSSSRKSKRKDKEPDPSKDSIEQACNEQPDKPGQAGEDMISCDFCARWCDTISTEDPARAMPAYVMTEREYRILTDMKRIKAEARNIKNRMGEIEKYLVDNMVEMDATGKKFKGDQNEPELQRISEDWLSLAQRLDALKELWKDRDRERLEAAEERMRLLGHIQ